MSKPHPRDTTRQRRNVFLVAGAAAIGLLLFELVFKSQIIFSSVFVLDDAFMFERAIHQQPFNDLGEFLPAFQVVDFDKSPGLKFYRFMSELAGEIARMRLIYLGYFAITCALIALVIYRVTQDRILSALTAILSCITPFSPVLVLFTNGSYNIVYFGLFFAALLTGTFINPENQPRRNIILIVTMTVWLLLSAVFVEVGFLLSLAALIWLVYYTRAYASSLGRALFALSGALIIAQAAWILMTYNSTYEAMPGRVNYELGSMFFNGLSIINRSISSFWDPMISTGQPTLQSSLWVSIGFICAVLGLYAFAGLKLLRGDLDWTKVRAPLSFALFASVSAVLSIGPYTALKLSHLWHYFPHMIFLCASSFLLVYIILSKKLAYGMIAVATALTAQTYNQQIPAYQAHVQQQELFADFIRMENQAWTQDDRVVLFFDGRILGGLNSTFRSTGFLRYVLTNPDAPIIMIVPAQAANRSELIQSGGTGSIHAYEMDRTGAYEAIPSS